MEILKRFGSILHCLGGFDLDGCTEPYSPVSGLAFGKLLWNWVVRRLVFWTGAFDGGAIAVGFVVDVQTEYEEAGVAPESAIDEEPLRHQSRGFLEFTEEELRRDGCSAE